MTTQRSAWAVKAYGTPTGKGSMRCVGGKGRHQLINNSPTTQKWQDRVAEAAQLLVAKYPEVMPLQGPLGAQITITVDRPKSVDRPWPHLRTAGDVDKHARCVLDGLEQGGVLADDAQVVQLAAVKAYPDSPRAVDVLKRSGVFIRLYLI